MARFEEIAPAQVDLVTLARLRFLAEAAIAVLTVPSAQLRANQQLQFVPDNASEDMLRTLLQFALPLLQSTTHAELARQIGEALGEPQTPTPRAE